MGLSSELLDDLIGAGKQRLRHHKVERFRGFQVDNEFELRRPLDGQIFGLFSLKDAINILDCPPEEIAEAGPVGDKAALRKRRTHKSQANGNGQSFQ